MKTTILLLISLFAIPAFSQDTAKPETLLGLSYQQFRELYPEECHKLRSARDLDRPQHASESCEIKHRAKELFPGCEIKKEVVFFGNGRVVGVWIIPKSVTLAALIVQYGAPDPPETTTSSYAYGTATYGSDDGSSTTLDPEGESHSMLQFWFRPTFTIVFSACSYMSWHDMVDRDSNIFGPLFNRPAVTQKIQFETR